MFIGFIKINGTSNKIKKVLTLGNYKYDYEKIIINKKWSIIKIISFILYTLKSSTPPTSAF